MNLKQLQVSNAKHLSIALIHNQDNIINYNLVILSGPYSAGKKAIEYKPTEDVELGSSWTRLLETQLLASGKYWNDSLGE